MRDGTRLFTIVYAPKDHSRSWPILLNRTPYGVAPYDEREMAGRLGPSNLFPGAGYIFAYQDVRGRFMSEGTWRDVRPCLGPGAGPKDFDESTDTFDTIEYLLRQVPGHNGRVGMWGISYPGFFCSTGMINAHPALVAVSPQAPVADWWYDDLFHHGAFFLAGNFGFISRMDRRRPAPTTQSGPGFDPGTPDGYQFFLDLGPVINTETRCFRGQVEFWPDVLDHPDYDAFWQERCVLPHLRKVAPAVLVVGGWFDAEDLYGTLATYRTVEQQNPGITNTLVMGPWRHGGWARDPGDRLGDIVFGSRTSEYYRRHIERAFFDRWLKDDRKVAPLPEACVFETGANRWRTFETWPPAGLRAEALVPGADGVLSLSSSAGRPAGGPGYDEFISDPARPVPFTESITAGAPPEFMTADQRFAARRPDVLVYQTAPLAKRITVAGPLEAELWVSTSAGDADWIVKLIDVYPPDAKDFEGMSPGRHLGGYQMLVRSEAIRGRFREDRSRPRPFASGVPALVRLPLVDILHSFEPGHRIMIQVQSSWFPLIDRNPQTYVENIFRAAPEDFVKATHRLYHDAKHTTRIRMSVLEPDARISGTGQGKK
jgi:putative CocE/NonD family hydrolase